MLTNQTMFYCIIFLSADFLIISVSFCESTLISFLVFKIFENPKYNIILCLHNAVCES